ncbi:Uncharacterised protein [uncultured archaeon]|nr:Uncharacterised protein [uncultured archaeon]
MAARIIPGRFRVVQEVSTRLIPENEPELVADLSDSTELDTQVSQTVNSISYSTGRGESTAIRTFRTPKILNGLRAAIQAFRNMYQAQSQYETEKRKQTRQLLAEYGVELANYRAAETTDPTYSRRETAATAEEIREKGLEGFFK